MECGDHFFVKSTQPQLWQQRLLAAFSRLSWSLVLNKCQCPLHTFSEDLRMCNLEQVAISEVAKYLHRLFTLLICHRLIALYCMRLYFFMLRVWIASSGRDNSLCCIESQNHFEINAGESCVICRSFVNQVIERSLIVASHKTVLNLKVS